MSDQEKLELLEKMLKDIKESYLREKVEIDRLKEEGKEKSATYKHYLGNRLLYNWVLGKYKEYGLIKDEDLKSF